MSDSHRPAVAVNPLDHLLSHRLRGFSPHEASLSALAEAVRSPIPYLEVDTRLSADGEILVVHDTRYDRLARASGRVRDLPTRSSGPPLFKGAPEERIGRFEELAGRFAAAGTRQVLMVDIKDFGAEEEHYEILARHRLLDRVHIISWLPEVLLRCREIDPRLPLSFSHIPLTRHPAALRVGLALLGSGALLRWLGGFAPPGHALFECREVILYHQDYDREPPPPGAGGHALAALQGTFPIHLLDGLPGGRLGEALRASHGSVGIPAAFLTPEYSAAVHAAGLSLFVFSLDQPAQIEDALAGAAADVIFVNDVRPLERNWAQARTVEAR